jgi:hypothetical protein
MKPVSYWIQFLPSPYREKAELYHVHYGYDKKDLKSDNLKSALIKMFPWRETPEGFDGWYKVFNALKYKDCHGLKPA